MLSECSLLVSQSVAQSSISARRVQGSFFFKRRCSSLGWDMDEAAVEGSPLRVEMPQPVVEYTDTDRVYLCGGLGYCFCVPRKVIQSPG